jgi:hypothetical protein
LNYAVDERNGVAGLHIAQPVQNGDTVIGVMVLTVRLEPVQTAWRQRGAPVVLTDNRGIVFLSSEPEWLYTTTRPISQGESQLLTQSQQYGKGRQFAPIPWKVTRQDGEEHYRVATQILGEKRDFLALDTPLEDWGWTLTQTSDLAIARQTRWSAIAFATLACGFVLFGALYLRHANLVAAFDVINDNFKSLFEALFGGGQAELKLVESDDPLEAGLEIYACPPGKRLSVMSLMSGGEQALTAAALIFAVFLANPAPVCVLDEVDAPLDDANVDRFCRMLDAMRTRTDTRFIVITHNPVTMSRMDRLYGVTMPERGVSQLVSVDLTQAESLVA